MNEVTYMNKRYPHVTEPIRVGGTLIKNRIILAPSTIHSANDGTLYPTEDSIAFFEQRAKTGAGIVYCAGVKYCDVKDDGEHTNWDTQTYNHKHKLAHLAERIHFHGAKAGMEIIGFLPGIYTCSDGNCIMGSPPIGKEAPKEVLEQTKNDIANACASLVECGFDSVLFHFGHSVPLAQFLSPLTNHRTDEYGGSTENRCRYICEILDAVRAKVGRKLLIEVRMSGSEYEPGGIDLEEGIRIGEIIQDKIDILQVSAGIISRRWMTWTHPCGHLPPHPNLWLAEAFKKSGKFHVPITAVSGFGNIAEAEEAIAEGKCDFVAIARAFIADPDMMKKCLTGHEDDVVPCVKCMRCHDSAVYGHQFACTVNPAVGLEASIGKIVPAAPESIKRVAVIGGGPAGMKAALTAAERGHEVTLYEKEDHLGGALSFSNYVDFKYALRAYKDYLAYQVEKSNIRLKLNTEATPEMINGQYDAVIIAVGAEPLILPLPGIENGVVATSVYGKEDTLGKSVVIIGGGQVGCETALHLCEKGIHVSIVEMQSSLAPDAAPTCRTELMVLLGDQAEAGMFTELTNAKCKSVVPGAVTYVDGDGNEQTVTGDTIILASGMRSKSALADSFMMTDIPECVEVGDCVRARTAEQATREGFYAAVNL